MAVTLLDEMRAARGLGLQTFALWRLGEEDSSLWNMWDKPSKPGLAAGARLGCSPGTMWIPRARATSCASPGLPQPGQRTVQVDTDEPDPRKKLIVDEHMDVYPRTYTIEQYGYHPNEVALSFDDGPDPEVDAEDSRHPEAEKREGHLHAHRRRGGGRTSASCSAIVREGNEIGNHTWTHPDISEISQRQLDLEVKLTERLFASKLGVQPLYFRPPYDIDEEPDTDDQAAPVVPHSAEGLHRSSATRSTPTTGTSIRARRPQEIIAIGADAAADHEDQAAVPAAPSS